MNLVLSILAFGLLAGFLGILAFEVNHNDLSIVIAIATAMCAFDFVRSVRAKEQH